MSGLRGRSDCPLSGLDSRNSASKVVTFVVGQEDRLQLTPFFPGTGPCPSRESSEGPDDDSGPSQDPEFL